jgi:hypothetical protein
MLARWTACCVQDGPLTCENNAITDWLTFREFSFQDAFYEYFINARCAATHG